MRVSKVERYDIICQHCGCHITLRADEYKKYLEKTENYGNEIITTELMPNEKEETELERYCMSCPECDGYIALNLTPIDADKYGFNLPKGVSPFYGPSYELSMEDYLKQKFNDEESEEDIE